MIQPPRPPALALLRQAVLVGIVGALVALAWLELLRFAASGAMCTVEGLGCFAFNTTILPVAMLAAALVAFGLMGIIGALRAWQVALMAPFIAGAFAVPMVLPVVFLGDPAPATVPFVGLVVLSYVVAGLVSMPGVRRAWPIGLTLAMLLALVWWVVSWYVHVGTPTATP